MKKIICALGICFTLYSCSQSTAEQDKLDIISILQTQEKAWSNHDLEGFMDGYWKNDSLKFYGANGLKYGWKTTLEGYRKRYPTPEHTGELNFIIDDISNIGKDSYSVMGQYHLNRPIGNANGVFMIIFKKINGAWKIIADLSC